MPYLAWIKTLPCAACGRYADESRPSEAAHVGNRGFAQKCRDEEAIPLCASCHRTGPLAQHVIGKRFWDVTGINKLELIAALNETWKLLGQKATQ